MRHFINYKVRKVIIIIFLNVQLDLILFVITYFCSFLKMDCIKKTAELNGYFITRVEVYLIKKKSLITHHRNWKISPYYRLVEIYRIKS